MIPMTFPLNDIHNPLMTDIIDHVENRRCGTTVEILSSL